MAVVKVLVTVGALAGLSSVMVVMMLAQPRIFLSMSKDGLLPEWAGRVHPRFHTPHISTIVTGVVVALAAGLTPIGTLGTLVSIGTLMAFVIVSLGIIVLRRTRPDLPRPFRMPWVPGPAGPVGARQPGADARPPARHVGAPDHLDGDRGGVLLPLRISQEPAAGRSAASRCCSLSATRADGLRRARRSTKVTKSTKISTLFVSFVPFAPSCLRRWRVGSFQRDSGCRGPRSWRMLPACRSTKRTRGASCPPSPSPAARVFASRTSARATRAA